MLGRPGSNTHPKWKGLLNNLVGVKTETGDPSSMKRLVGGSYDNPLSNVPVEPGVAITGVKHIRYDMVDGAVLDTTNTWQNGVDANGTSSVRSTFDTTDNEPCVELYTGPDDYDYTFLQTRNPQLVIESGKSVWFEARVKIRDDLPGSDVDDAIYFIGLANLMAPGERPMGVYAEDGSYSADRSTWVGFDTVGIPGRAGISAGASGSRIATWLPNRNNLGLYDGEWHDIAINYDGAGTISVWRDHQYCKQISISPTQVDSMASVPLYFTFGIMNTWGYGESQGLQSLMVSRIQVVVEE